MKSFVPIETMRQVYETAIEPEAVRWRIHDAIVNAMQNGRCFVEIEMDTDLQPYYSELRREGYQCTPEDFWPVVHDGPKVMTKMKIFW